MNGKHSLGGFPITGRAGYIGKHEERCGHAELNKIGGVCGEIAAYQSDRHGDVLCLSHANEVVRYTGEPVRPL